MTILQHLVDDALHRARLAGCTDCGEQTLCGEHFTPEIEDAGWNEVAERMDRWGANGYAGDWQDPQYNPPADDAVTR